MENYRISSETLELPQEIHPGGISNLISLSNNHVWIYFTSGLSQYWSLYDITAKGPRLINSMNLKPGLFHTFALSHEKIGVYDHIDQRLRVIRLADNKIDTNFVALLPTNNTIGNNSERNDERKIEEIARETKFCVFVKTETVVVLEKTMSGAGSDSIISVFKETNCPEPFKQKIHNSNNSALATLNEEDTILIYQSNSEKTHVFFVWNVFLDEKNMRKIVIKNDLCCNVISATAFGAGKFAIWLNAKDSGKPEIAVVDYASQTSLKKESEMSIEYEMDRRVIDYFAEDWLLLDVICYDEEKKLALISKSGEFCSLELINMRTLRPFFSKGPLNSEEDTIDLTQSLSLDNKSFVEYIKVLGGDEDEDDIESEDCEEEIQENHQIIEKKIVNKKVEIIINSFIPLKMSLLNMLERKKILEKYGAFFTNEIIDMITLDGK